MHQEKTEAVKSAEQDTEKAQRPWTAASVPIPAAWSAEDVGTEGDLISRPWLTIVLVIL